MTESDIAAAFTALHYAFPIMAAYSRLLNYTEIARILSDPDHVNKAAGYPLNTCGAPSKGDAVEMYGVERLLDLYRADVSVLTSTLKDELRELLKDARLFRPTDVTTFAEALRLFQLQNEYLASTIFNSPLFFKFVTPGPDLGFMYHNIRKFGGNNYDADAARWDANYPLIIATIVCAFRAESHPEPASVVEYFSRIYNGFTHVTDGRYTELLHLIGNSSGHLNTTTDNCLGHVIAMSVHARRSGLTFQQFIEGVLYYCCGDDLIWSDKTGMFTPVKLSATYADLGMFLEFTSLDPVPFEQLTFVCTHPKIVEYEGRRFMSYYYSDERLRPKVLATKKNYTAVDQIQKIASIAALMFNSPDYQYYYDLFFHVTAQKISTGDVDMHDPRVLGAARSIQRTSLMRQYSAAEGGL